MKMKALVIVDMLNDFVNPNGKLPVPNAENIVDNIARLRAAYPKVIYANDAHAEDDPEFQVWPEHAVKGTDGANIIPQLAPVNGEVVLEKQDLYMFTNPNADAILRQQGIDELYITGVATEYCVRGVALTDKDKFGNTVQGAIQRGYKVNVVVDAIAGVDLKPGDQYRALVEMGNAGVRAVTTQQALEEMVK